MARRQVQSVWSMVLFTRLLALNLMILENIVISSSGSSPRWMSLHLLKALAGSWCLLCFFWYLYSSFLLAPELTRDGVFWCHPGWGWFQASLLFHVPSFILSFSARDCECWWSKHGCFLSASLFSDGKASMNPDLAKEIDAAINSTAPLRILNILKVFPSNPFVAYVFRLMILLWWIQLEKGCLCCQRCIVDRRVRRNPLFAWP